MTDHDRIQHLEITLYRLLRDLKKLPHCEKCSLRARHLAEMDLIEVTGHCEICTAEMDAEEEDR